MFRKLQRKMWGWISRTCTGSPWPQSRLRSTLPGCFKEAQEWHSSWHTKGTQVEVSIIIQSQSRHTEHVLKKKTHNISCHPNYRSTKKKESSRTEIQQRPYGRGMTWAEPTKQPGFSRQGRSRRQQNTRCGDKPGAQNPTLKAKCTANYGAKYVNKSATRSGARE